MKKTMHEMLAASARIGEVDRILALAKYEQIPVDAELDQLVASLVEHRKTCQLWYCSGDQIMERAIDCIQVGDATTLATLPDAAIGRLAKAQVQP